MARLRRKNCESFHESDSDRQEVRKRAISRTHGDHIRRSPRKKTIQSYDEAGGNRDPASLPPCNSTPKPRLPATRQSKQVRLQPLGGFHSAAAPPALPFDPEPRRRRPSPKKGPPLLQPEPEEQKQPTVHLSPPSLRPLSPAQEATEEIEESDIEESVWCGSDAGSDSSDGLPSPSKLIKFPPRRLPSDLPRTLDLDLSDKFKTLSLAEPTTRSLGQDRGDSDSSRPTSSSDKENDDRAILRFSPPRLYSPRKQFTPKRQSTPPPTSPSKGRLQSPSKRTARVPTPPLRPSIDAFWNVEKVNEWNDQYSPRKEWKSPKKHGAIGRDRSSSPTASPRKPQSPTKRSKADIEARKDWEARKRQIAESFLAEVDRAVTNGQVQQLAKSTGGVRFIWSKTLNTTAGRANWKRETTKTRQPDGSVTVVHKHHASIELAEKVIDDEERLLNVIAHEFCHLCNFMISGIKDQPHGKQFKDWGRRCTDAFRHRGVEVTTKHSYQIEYKYVWQCSNEECAARFQRHSKSIDPKRHKCGNCRSNLLQIKPVPRQGTAAGGPATGYAAYVKQNFAMVKAGMLGASQKEVMEALGRKYRADKAAGLPVPIKGAGALSSEGNEPTASLSEIELSDSREAATDEVEKVARVLKFVTLEEN